MAELPLDLFFSNEGYLGETGLHQLLSAAPGQSSSCFGSTKAEPMDYNYLLDPLQFDSVPEPTAAPAVGVVPTVPSYSPPPAVVPDASAAELPPRPRSRQAAPAVPTGDAAPRSSRRDREQQDAHAAEVPGPRSRPSRLRAAPKKYQDLFRQPYSESDGELEHEREREREREHEHDLTPNSTDDEEVYHDHRPPRSAGKSGKRPRRAGAESDDEGDGYDEAVGAEMATDDEVLSGMLDPKEERHLRQQLKRHLKDLDACTAQSRGMSPLEKKKLRNRKASRVSRLRKKLSVFDLQRKYQATLGELDRCRATLEGVSAQLQRHEPGFRCPLLLEPRPKKARVAA